MQPLTIKSLGLTGRLKKSSGRYPANTLVGRLGEAKPPLVHEGGLKGAPRTIWGHASVEGRLNAGSVLEFGASTILGAIKGAMKTGGRESVIETLARMASKAIVSEFERELKREIADAYAQGYKTGAAEATARERAAQRAADGATTIFPKAERLLAKQDYESAYAAAETLLGEHGSKIAGTESRENIPPVPVTSISGWVQAAGLVDGNLAIQFRGSKSGGPVVCVYPGHGRGELESLLGAASAGKWVHRHVYRANYDIGGFSIGG